MSESSFTSFHRLGILMSGAGRFVTCIDCHLAISFPAGAHYDRIVRQFESRPCNVPPPNDDRTESLTQTVGMHVDTANE